MQKIILKSIILIFSTQGLVDHYGLLPRHVIYIAHLGVIGLFFYYIVCDIQRVISRKRIMKYNFIEKSLIIFLTICIFSVYEKNINILTGLVGVKNLLMFPMIYFIIRRTKYFLINEAMNFYLKILLIQIPVILYQGISTNWDDEMLTGTFGYHTTGINGVIYTAISSLGLIKYFITKKKESLLLLLFLIIPGISGIRASLILLLIVGGVIVTYYLIFLKNKIVFLIKGIAIIFIVINIIDYTHLVVEKVKITTLYKERFSGIMMQQIMGYGIDGSNDNLTHFGRISSLIFVWGNLHDNNNLLFGNGPGLARDSLFGKTVKVKGGFVFKGSPGGMSTIWYEHGVIGVLIYASMVLGSILLIFFKAIKNNLLNIDYNVLWGIVIGFLYLLGNFYTTLWHTFAAFHFWLIMGLITVNIDRVILFLNSCSISRRFPPNYI